MRTLSIFIISAALFVTSEAVLAYYGYVKIYLVFFIPVFVSSSALSFAPLLFFLVPFAFFLYSGKWESHYERTGYEDQPIPETPQNKTSGIGGIVMIGPIPIIFGKGISGKVLITLVIIALVLIVTWFLLSK